MNLETTRTHTLTLNDRERDLLATILDQREPDQIPAEIDAFTDTLLEHLHTAGAHILLGPDEAMPTTSSKSFTHHR